MLWQEGYLAFSPRKYNTADLRDLRAHLTNVEGHVGEDEEPPKMKLSDFFAYAWRHGQDPVAMRRQMREFLAKSVLSSALLSRCPENYWAGMRRLHGDSSCFELFGVDFMLDARWNVYLLEINLSPAVTHTDDARMRVQTAVVRDLVAAFGLGAADPRPAHVLL